MDLPAIAAGCGRQAGKEKKSGVIATRVQTLKDPPAVARLSWTFWTKYELVSKKRSTQLARQLCSFPEKLDEIEPTHLDGGREGGN